MMTTVKRSTVDEHRYYGLVEGVVEGAESSRSRSSLLFDCVSADRFDRDGRHVVKSDESLALVRTMSTERVWRDRFGIDALKPGDWVEFTLNVGSQGPLAWEMPAENGYLRGRVRSLSKIRRLGTGLEPDPTASSDLLLATRLNRAVNILRANRKIVTPVALLQTLQNRGEPLSFVVLDVGQASAILIKRGNRDIGLFDAGAPVWFNRGSLRLPIKPPLLTGGFIFLSHWDWDHFDLGRRHAPYHALDWYAPDQEVGFNTARFQQLLGGKLTFIHGSFGLGGFRFAPGLSTDPKDRNGTGFQLRYDDGNQAVVLTGDADYAQIDTTMLKGATALSIPHHGGKGGPPPAAAGVARAVASYGVPNRYRHPASEFEP
jgi:hypothetical protein